MTKQIATATYRDAYAGEIGATLVSTTKGFRWIDSRGSFCDGLAAMDWFKCSAHGFPSHSGLPSVL